MRLDKKKIICVLIDKDMNQKDLANATKISRTAINTMINGRKISNETACKIAKALNVSVEELIEQ